MWVVVMQNESLIGDNAARGQSDTYEISLIQSWDHNGDEFGREER